MLKEEIKKIIEKAVRELGAVDELKEIPLEHPENEEHGDYATSVAFALAKKLGKSPQEIAQAIVSAIGKQSFDSAQDKSEILEKVEAVGGFVNFYLSHKVFEAGLQTVLKEKENFGENDLLKGKKIMVEFAHPNTHKEMHIGHMRTLVTGEALSRMFEANGAKVFRANYQGDIGPHVAKGIWGTQKLLQEQQQTWEDAEALSLGEKAHLLGKGYVRGNEEYEENKLEIDGLNDKLYKKDKEAAKVYERTRTWSLEYYNALYMRFDTKFNKLYFESQIANTGKETVLKNMGKVFQESDGAIVFKGEQYGLHTRVFVTQDGNPTYEAKEIGLAPAQYKDFPFDLNIHVVANEQSGYFQVVFKALELVDKKFEGKEYHLPMGMVQLVGKKMSSRTGVIVTVDDLLSGVQELLAELITSKELTQKELEQVEEIGTIAAVKYSVLKTDTKSNVLFDMERSVALDGNSGPYVLYTYARCKSILRKANSEKSILLHSSILSEFSKEEMSIMRLAYQFPEVVQEAAEKFAPSMLCTYVFGLAQKYNAFYNTNPVLQADTKEQKEFRLALTAACAHVIQNSLHLLGIKTLERM